MLSSDTTLGDTPVFKPNVPGEIATDDGAIWISEDTHASFGILLVTPEQARKAGAFAWQPFETKPQSERPLGQVQIARSEDDAQGPFAKVRVPPELLSKAEREELLALAEQVWKDLSENDLGGYSNANRPFWILIHFKRVIEKFGHRDVGGTWSKNDLDAVGLSHEDI